MIDHLLIGSGGQALVHVCVFIAGIYRSLASKSYGSCFVFIRSLVENKQFTYFGYRIGWHFLAV